MIPRLEELMGRTGSVQFENELEKTIEAVKKRSRKILPEGRKEA